MLPALGWRLDRRGARGIVPLRVAAGLYALTNAAVFGQALLGWPLVRR